MLACGLWWSSLVIIVALGVALSYRLNGGFIEVSVAVTRSTVIALVIVAVLPPLCLTVLWLRMQGRRKSERRAHRP